MKTEINKKRILIWSVLLIWPYILMAQFNFIGTGYHDYSFRPQNLGLSTPQSADFQRYGNIPVNHYNGLLDLEIELDGYKDKDFDLPVSLKYISNGFIPAKRPSVVGNNWVLNFGGLITRTVKGSPDDTKGNYTKDARKYMKDGLLVAMRNGTYVRYSEAKLTAFDVPKNGQYYSDGDFKHDYEPDVFHFNFGNHQGKFYITHSGGVVCTAGTGYKIDIHGMPIQSYSTTEPPVASTIKITTPDGYIYEFGGNTSYLEYNIPNNPDKAGVNPRHIISWYLKSIKSTNNRQVLFTYTPRLLPNHYNYYMYAYKKTVSVTNNGRPFGDDEEESSKIEIKDKVYSPVIKEVTIDKAKLVFETTPGVEFFDAGDPTYCISKISLMYNNFNIKESNFTYETKGKYIFLKELKKNLDKYNFDYHEFEPPSPLTTSVDHWGYWNGQYETEVYDIKQFCELTEKNRNTKHIDPNATLLKKITYPTGGYSEIHYEGNTYRKYFTKTFSGIYMDEEERDVNCGGSRVSHIVDGFLNNRRFFTYNAPNSNKSSGVIFTKPRYKNTEVFYYFLQGFDTAIFGECSTKDISSNSLGVRENIGEYHVGYSDVIEKHSKGYNHYEYTSHIDIPNSMDGFKGKGFNKNTTYPFFQYPILEKAGLDISNDLSHFRGKLKKVSMYAGYDVLKQTIEYNYNLSEAKRDYITTIASAYRGYSSYRIYTRSCLLLSKTVTDETGVTTIENFDYNGNNLVVIHQVTNSDGKVYKTEYVYPVIGRACSWEADCYMQAKNILTKPFEQTVYVGDSIVDYTLYNYKEKDGFVALGKISKADFVSPKPYIDPYNLTVKECCDVHDKYGNPVHVTHEDGTETVYLWAYKGQYLIAEIALQDETYNYIESIVKGIFNVSDINELSDMEYPDVNGALTGRLQEVLMQLCHVTTYTHQPLVGITSITDPAGNRTYYVYDYYKRLKEVYRITNGQKEVVETYQYNNANK